MDQQSSLFNAPNLNSQPEGMLVSSRPSSLDSIVGQQNVIAQLTPLISKLSAHFIFYGPSGCGKTSICFCIENSLDLPTRHYNPVSQTLSELKKINTEMNGAPFILSVDEIHRMDKKQQEFLLPFLENGRFKLIASTTQNPYTFFTRAIISRVIPIKLNGLSQAQIEQILIEQKNCDPTRAKKIAALDLNDARKAILLHAQSNHIPISGLDEYLKQLSPQAVYDKTRHYDLLSALIKSMRASEIEQANKWLAHLIVEGAELATICRRLMIFASEDIGDAAPYALMKTVACAQAVEKIGMPEAQIILGDCVSFLAKSPKSRENYERIKQHLQSAREGFTGVPRNLRNREN